MGTCLRIVIGLHTACIPILMTQQLGQLCCLYVMSFKYPIHTEHKCSFPGCGIALVIDGNQKIRRSVCGATHAGFVEYPSLPTPICTGCVNSPAFKSRFCDKHTPRSCKTKPNYLSESEITGENAVDQLKPKDEEVVELLLEKKCTRGGTYYKVRHGDCYFLMHGSSFFRLHGLVVQS